MEQQAPFQSHSGTSRLAAEELTSAETMRTEILQRIRYREKLGMTGDELADWFKIVPGTISARLIELERAGSIVRLHLTRRTKANRKAYVYIAKEFLTDGMKVFDAAEEETSRMSNKEAIETAANFLKGLIVGKQLPSEVYIKRAQEIEALLRGLIRQSAARGRAAD